MYVSHSQTVDHKICNAISNINQLCSYLMNQTCESLSSTYFTEKPKIDL